MIATPKKPRPELTREHHQQRFLAMLPTITRMARQTFSDLDAEAKEEAVAEVVATALIMFVGLIERGREAAAFPTVLAAYGIRRVRVGRQAATPRNACDVTSMHCQIQRGVRVEHLDRYDRQKDAWQEIVVEDKHATPADVACVRIDFADWLKTLSRRNRRIAETLATGETTGETAQKYQVTPSRISHLRRELFESWERFIGETDDGTTADTCATAAA